MGPPTFRTQFAKKADWVPKNGKNFSRMGRVGNFELQVQNFAHSRKFLWPKSRKNTKCQKCSQFRRRRHLNTQTLSGLQSKIDQNREKSTQIWTKPAYWFQKVAKNCPKICHFPLTGGAPNRLRQAGRARKARLSPINHARALSARRWKVESPAELRRGGTARRAETRSFWELKRREASPNVAAKRLPTSVPVGHAKLN